LSDNIIVPGLSEDETVTVNVLNRELKARSRRNLIRSSYYDGKRAIRQIGSVIPPQYYRLGIALGWAAKGVDGLDRRVNLEEMIWTDGDLDKIGMSELEESNFLLSELASARTDAFIHGVSYVITTQGAEGEPRALVHAKDARNAFGQWNSRKRALDNLLSVTSWDGSKITGSCCTSTGRRSTPSASTGSGRSPTAPSTRGACRRTRSCTVPAPPAAWGGPGSPGRSCRPRTAALRALIRLEGHMDIYSIPKMSSSARATACSRTPTAPRRRPGRWSSGASWLPDDEDAANPRADVKQFDAAVARAAPGRPERAREARGA
jgi:hypothetical protein